MNVSGWVCLGELTRVSLFFQLVRAEGGRVVFLNSPLTLDYDYPGESVRITRHLVLLLWQASGSKPLLLIIPTTR